MLNIHRHVNSSFLTVVAIDFYADSIFDSVSDKSEDGKKS